MLNMRVLTILLLFWTHVFGEDPSINTVFEQVMGKFITERGFSGAVVCIYQKHEMILHQAYGSGVDVDQIYPLASNTKIFTRSGIEKLIKGHLLSKEDKVWPYLDLTMEPKDPRVKEITIGQLLEHQGGWDRDVSSDPLFSSLSALSTRDLIEQVIQSTMLDFSPGTQKSYSNFGYLLLGEIIERITGMSYLDYINKNFAAPLQVEVFQAKTPLTYTRNTPFAETFCLEQATSSLGIAMKVQDVAKTVSFLSSNKQDNWWLDGSLPGTITSLIRRRVNNVTIVVFIPDRDDNCWKDDNDDLRKEIDHAANRVGL